MQKERLSKGPIGFCLESLRKNSKANVTETMATVGGKVTSWLEKDGDPRKVLNRGRYQMFSLTKRCSSNFISGHEKVTGVRLTLLE